MRLVSICGNVPGVVVHPVPSTTVVPVVKHGVIVAPISLPGRVVHDRDLSTHGMMQPMPGTTNHPVNQEAINHQFTARADIRHVVAGLGGLGLHLAASQQAEHQPHHGQLPINGPGHHLGVPFKSNPVPIQAIPMTDAVSTRSTEPW